MMLSCRSDYRYLFVSQADVAQWQKEDRQNALRTWLIYAIIQQDTILITQLNVINKPLRNNNDVQYIGCGEVDHYEVTEQYRGAPATFVHFKSFKRAK